jgi:predicted ATPase
MLEKDPRGRPTATDVAALLSQMAGTSPPLRARRATGPSQRRGVGREKERAALGAAFESAAAGRGLLACVTGEPGIGKTTLVEDFLAELDVDALCRVARGRCSERLAGTEAYLPWLEALEDLLRSASGAEMARLLKVVAPSWYAQISPSDQNVEQSPSASGTASPERLKRELAAFLQEVLRVRPFVLFFDDIHWSDVSTIDQLTYLGTRLPSMSLLVVATYRPSELVLSQHPFGSAQNSTGSMEV